MTIQLKKCLAAWFHFMLALNAIAGAAELPNILWITAEDMSPQLGCYGDSYARTPHIDALAARGIRYSNFFAESPMCSPSRATIITGMHNGPLGASQMRSNHRVPEYVRPFTSLLRDAGYFCANNAKTDYNLAWGTTNDESEFANAAWDVSGPNAHWRDRPTDKPFFCVLNFIDTHQSRSSRDDYSVFVKNVQSRLSPDRIHDPASAPLPPHYPDSPIARRTLARYYDCISVLDDFVGQTLDALKSDGLAEDTVIFFYSDHGAGLPTGKGCATDFGLRCPLVVHVPDKWRQFASQALGSISDRLVCFADLAPTVLELAKVEAPKHMHGRSFLGLDRAAAPAYVLGTRDRMDETLETTRWISDGRYLLVRAYRHDVPCDQQSLTSWYNGSGELCQEIRGLRASDALSETQLRFWSDHRPSLQLFDTQSDPWCLKDLSTDAVHGKQAELMEQELDRFLLTEHDLGFWPEPELTAAEQQASARELARTSDLYPLKRILETAKLTEPALLRERLSDPNSAVRYWAVLGLGSAGGEHTAIADSMQFLLTDDAASVRIEAAFQIAQRIDSAAALNVLAEELDSENQWAACRAARALELLGERSRGKIVQMRTALKQRAFGFFHKPQGPRPVHTGLEFSLLTALNKLGIEP